MGFFGKRKPTQSCKRCSKRVLTRQQFIEELNEKHSIRVDPQTLNPIMSGAFVGGWNTVGSKQQEVLAIHKRLDLDRAYKCKNCGAVYCAECLVNFAPTHANGGKACFSCRGALAET